jgi:hypothetical protein
MRPAILFKSHPNILAYSDVWYSSIAGYEHDVQISTVDPAGAARAAFDYPEDFTGVEANDIVSLYLLELFPYSDSEASASSSDGPVDIVLHIDDEHRFRRVGVFDFRRPKNLWLQLHEQGSVNHDTRKEECRKLFFEQCAEEEFTLY